MLSVLLQWAMNLYHHVCACLDLGRLSGNALDEPGACSCSMFFGFLAFGFGLTQGVIEAQKTHNQEGKGCCVRGLCWLYPLPKKKGNRVSLAFLFWKEEGKGALLAFPPS